MRMRFLLFVIFTCSTATFFQALSNDTDIEYLKKNLYLENDEFEAFRSQEIPNPKTQYSKKTQSNHTKPTMINKVEDLDLKYFSDRLNIKESATVK